MTLTRDQITTLRKLAQCKSAKNRRDLLLGGGPPLQHAIRECAYNVIKGSIPLTEKQRKALKKNNNPDCVRELARKKTPLKKRLAIEQKGGFLASLLVPVITSILGGTLSGSLSRR